MTTRRLGALAAAGLAVVLAACSGGASAGEDVPQMFRDRIEQLRAEHPDNGFFLDVLADYEITDAEAHAALDQFSGCMAEFGFAAYRNIDGSGGGGALPEFPGGDEEALRAWTLAENRCTFYEQIVWLQREMHENPLGLTWAERVHDCLARDSEPEYVALTIDQVTDLVNGGCWQPESDTARMCLADPDGNLNLSLDWLRSIDQQFRRGGLISVRADKTTDDRTFYEKCGPDGLPLDQ